MHLTSILFAHAVPESYQEASLVDTWRSSESEASSVRDGETGLHPGSADVEEITAAVQAIAASFAGAPIELHQPFMEVNHS